MTEIISNQIVQLNTPSSFVFTQHSVVTSPTFAQTLNPVVVTPSAPVAFQSLQQHIAPVSNLGKRRDREEESEKETRTFVEQEPWSLEINDYVISKSSDALAVQKRICEGLLVFPNSQHLHCSLLLYIAQWVTNRRIRLAEVCESRLKNGLELFEHSLRFLTEGYFCTIKETLKSRNQSLADVFDEHFQNAVEKFASKTNDEITALVLQKAQSNLSHFTALMNEKFRKKVQTVQKAAVRLSMVTMSTSDVANEIDNLEDSKVCVVCTDSRRQICLDPCGHIALCIKCADISKDCPVCRVEIKKKLKFIVC